jgi:lysyl-tRNA synthetase, class II
MLSLAQLKEANASKLFNDICGLRKKMKLEVANPSLDEVKAWLA